MTQTIPRTDKELQANVTEELSYNPSIDGGHLRVMVKDGVVTLAGEVHSLPERHAAKRSAMRVWGVKAVTDEMVIRNPGTPEAKDTEIAEAANQMLGWAVDVPSDAVKANVRDHKITLAGTVDWQYQREAAARAVMYLRGITGLINTISLRPTAQTAPAAAMKPSIEAAILRNAQLDSREINVTVNGEEVTLRGTVPSCAERRQAEYVAWAAAGVTSVKNELVVTA